MKFFCKKAGFPVLILAAVLAVSSVVSLAGCQNGDTAATAPADTPTAAATTVPATAAATGNGDAVQNDSNAHNQQSETASADGSDQIEDDGYIDRATAIANVMQQAGSGARILSAEKGYSPEGFPAWVVVVAPVTTSDGPVTVTYYSGYQFCYTDSASSPDGDDDGYIDEAEAIANVRQQAGSGARILSAEKGYSPEGFPAWVIVVSPVTASDEPVTVTYYSGYQFCYKADADNAE